MTKKEIVKKIAARMGLSHGVVHEVVQQAFDEIIEALVKDQRMELRNFGVFEVRVRAPRKARNPRTNAWLRVPQRAAVVFKPGKEMMSRVGSLPLEELKRRLEDHLATPPEGVDTPPERRDDRPGEHGRAGH